MFQVIMSHFVHTVEGNRSFLLRRTVLMDIERILMFQYLSALDHYGLVEVLSYNS